MSIITKVRGLPGTGKTTCLAKMIREYLEEGVQLEEIGGSSFSRSTMYAIIKKLEGYDERIIKNNFRTIHSHCARALELNDKRYFVTIKDYQRFFLENGVEFEPFHVITIDEIDKYGEIGERFSMKPGNIMVNWWQYLKNYCVNEETIEGAIRRRAYIGDNDRYLNTYPSLLLLDLYRQWEERKEEVGRWEYNDILQGVLEDEFYLDVKYFFVDEAQDLSPLQFRVIEQWSREIKKLVLAYDTLQTIYFFNAADPTLVENVKGEEIILPTSYRVPEIPWEYAKRVAHYIGDTKIDKVKPAPRTGSFSYISYSDVIPLIKESREERTYLLFRTHYLLQEFLEKLLGERAYVRGFGRTVTMFDSPLFIDLYNVIRKLYRNEALSENEIKHFIISIPAKYLIRGKKTEIKKRGVQRDNIRRFIEESSHTIFYSYFRVVQRPEAVQDIIADPKTRISEAQKNLLLSITERSPPVMENISIGTYHAAKGLESSRVFCFDYFPHPRAHIKRDEARLIFVGLTRARNDVYLVSPEGYFEDGLVWSLIHYRG